MLLGVVVPAVLRHRGDLARARLHRDQRGRDARRVVRRHAALHGVGGERLLPRVQRGGDGQPAAVQPVDPLRLRRAERGVVPDHLGHVVAEVAGARHRHLRRHAADRPGVDVQGVGEGRRQARGELVGAEVALLVHQPEHEVAPLLGGGRVAHRVVGGRALGDPGDRRGLQVRHLGRRLAEVPLRSCLDPVGVHAELGDVQVRLEDLVLGHLLLERDRELRLPELARVALRPVGLARRLRPGGVARPDGLLDQDVLDVLLGQRRGALGAARGLQVADQRPDHALGVDAPVLVEPLVLDGDDRLPQRLGDGRQRDDHPVLRPERRQHRGAVGREDRRPLGQGLPLELGRQVLERLDREVRRAVGDGDRGQHQAGGEHPAQDRREDERQHQRDRPRDGHAPCGATPAGCHVRHGRACGRRSRPGAGGVIPAG